MALPRLNAPKINEPSFSFLFPRKSYKLRRVSRCADEAAILDHELYAYTYHVLYQA
jgi:hypothetical protein